MAESPSCNQIVLQLIFIQQPPDTAQLRLTWILTAITTGGSIWNKIGPDRSTVTAHAITVPI